MCSRSMWQRADLCAEGFALSALGLYDVVYSVLIADGHPFVRTGVRAELSRHSDIEVINESTKHQL
jgi:hypothetical protein